jgi:hypothetical protein
MHVQLQKILACGLSAVSRSLLTCGQPLHVARAVRAGDNGLLDVGQNDLDHRDVLGIDLSGCGPAINGAVMMTFDTIETSAFEAGTDNHKMQE